jgi:hypothetical protein
VYLLAFIEGGADFWLALLLLSGCHSILLLRLVGMVV